MQYTHSNLFARPLPDILHLSLKHFGQKEGLSSFNIRNIARDQYGIRWIATQGGLNTYDGLQFEKVVLPGNDLLSADISNVFFDKQTNTVYACSPYRGIFGIDARTRKMVFRYILNDSINRLLPDPWVRCAYTMGSNLWIGTQNGYACLDLHSLKLHVFPAAGTKSATKKRPVRSFVQLDEQRIAALVDGLGVVILNNQAQSILAAIEPVAFDSEFGDDGLITGFFPLTKDQFLLVTDKTAYKGEFRKSEKPTFQSIYNKKNTMAKGAITATAYDADRGLLWLATKEALIQSDLNRGTISRVLGNAAPFLHNWAGIINHFLLDQDDNIWISGEGGLWAGSTSPALFLSINLSNQVNKPLRLYGIYHSAKQQVFAASTQGIYRYDLTTEKVASVGKGAFAVVEKIQEGLLFVSGEEGSFLLSEDAFRLEPIHIRFGEWKPYPDFYANAIRQFGPDKYILSAEDDKGLLVWEKSTGKKKGKLYPVFEKEIAQRAVNNLKVLDGDSILILGDEFIAIAHLPTNKFREYTLKGSDKPYTVFFDALQIQDGYLLSSYGSGIIKTNRHFEFSGLYNELNGLSSNNVYQLYPIGPDEVVITTDHGLSILQVSGGQIQCFYEPDGLHNNGFEEGSLFAGPEEIILGGLNGFTLMYPGFNKKEGSGSGLYFYSIRLKTEGKPDTTILFPANQLGFPKNMLEAQLSFRLSNILQTGNSRFYYRIQELGNEWIYLGREPEIKLLGLKTGVLNLEIKSVDLHQPGKTVYFATQLQIPPPWYQTSWFYAICLLAAGGVTYALYRYRLAQIHKEYRFKEKIAADLHDDLGSTITGIKIFTEMGVSSGSPQYYAPVKEGLTQAALALREMIWVLDTKTNTLAEVFNKIESNVKPMLDSRKIHLSMRVDKRFQEYPLKTDTKRDIYLLLKEFINNSVKYAACNEIRIDASFKGKNPCIQISDNGQGFDLNAVNRGNGLNNMEKRAKQTGFTTVWTTSPGKGVTLQLQKG